MAALSRMFQLFLHLLQFDCVEYNVNVSFSFFAVKNVMILFLFADVEVLLVQF